MELQPETCQTCTRWNKMDNRGAGYCQLTGHPTISVETCGEWVGKNEEEEEG